MADVPRMHDDELVVEARHARPFVPILKRLKPRRIDPVRNDAQAIGRRALGLESLPHRLADCNDAIRTTEVKRDQKAQYGHHCRIFEPLELYGDLRKDVLADHDKRNAKSPRDNKCDVGDDRRIGHTEDDVRPRSP